MIIEEKIVKDFPPVPPSFSCMRRLRKMKKASFFYLLIYFHFLILTTLAFINNQSKLPSSSPYMRTNISLSFSFFLCKDGDWSYIIEKN